MVRPGQIRSTTSVKLIAFLVTMLVVVTGAALIKTAPSGPLLAKVRQPLGIMGADCRLMVTMAAGIAERQAEVDLKAAEAELRRVEVMMSPEITGAELERFNRSDAGTITVSPETMHVVTASRRLFDQTQGAFDATCRPLIELWWKGAKSDRLPSRDEIAEARAQSNWAGVDLQEGRLEKRSISARLDLGGIAKGYAIDRALEVFGNAGYPGGLVEVGGDLRCYGKPPETDLWEIGVLHPFDNSKLIAGIGIPSGAVCTSGNYYRFSTIQQKRYSHILDPRTGMPVEAAPSVTVVAPEAMEADAWATALSVLGAAGLEIFPKEKGYGALIISGEPGKSEIRMTQNFEEMLSWGPDL